LVVLNAFQENNDREPPVVEGISAKLDSHGALPYKLRLTNASGVNLRDLALDLVMVMEDGSKRGLKFNWPTWENAETKDAMSPDRHWNWKTTLRGAAFDETGTEHQQRVDLGLEKTTLTTGFDS
jgi:hypothetical protein